LLGERICFAAPLYRVVPKCLKIPKVKIGKGSLNPKSLWGSGQLGYRYCRLGHIPFGFDSFGSLVHLPVQGYILLDRFVMEVMKVWY